MKKTAKKSKRKQQKRETNWKVIGGVVVISGLVLFGMIFLAFREPNQLDLIKYCDNNPENCIASGPDTAAARMVEVSDYGCTHCRTFNLETAPLLEETYGNNDNFQHLAMPYALSGQSGGYPTMDSAVAAFCANEQNKFWEYHAATFALQTSPSFNTEEGILQTGENIGLDLDSFKSCLANNEYENNVRANIRAATNAGINSTPSFMIDGQVLAGAQPFTVFQQRIESLLSQ